MKCPNCITIDVLITECSVDEQDKHHRVSISTPQLGQFVTSFDDKGKDSCQLNWPFGIAVAKNGDVILVEYEGRRVRVFKL